MEKAYERIWNFNTKPFSLDMKKPFECLFCKGEMIVTHGHVFTFKLKLHGDAEKQSHAVDTWLNCWECGWTIVHGVAVPKVKYDEFVELVFKGQRVDKEGRLIKNESKEKVEIPEGESVTIFPQDKMKGKREKPKPTWEETNDIKGLRPLFPMTCKMCGFKEGMFLRHSRMHLVERNKFLKTVKIPRWMPFIGGVKIHVVTPLTKKVYSTHAFRISYKCPICDWLATFVRPVRAKYFEYILALRDGKPLYYPPLKEWEAELEKGGYTKEEESIIQEKLKTLGYV